MTLPLAVLGRVVGLEADDGLEHVLADTFVDLLAPADSEIEHHQPIAGGTPHDDLAAIVGAAMGTVNLAAISFGAGSLMPHAGAVAAADGSVALLCGGSGSGKTTLTRALIARGLAYLTDETTVLHPVTLDVTPFRKPLSIKPAAHSLCADLRPTWSTGSDDTWLVPASEVGSAPRPAGPLDPRLLLFPRWDPTVPAAEPQRVSAAQAAFLVGQQSSRLRDVVGGPLDALARLARRTRAYRLPYSDAERAADAVLDLWGAPR